MLFTGCNFARRICHHDNHRDSTITARNSRIPCAIESRLQRADREQRDFTHMSCRHHITVNVMPLQSGPASDRAPACSLDEIGCMTNCATGNDHSTRGSDMSISSAIPMARPFDKARAGAAGFWLAVLLGVAAPAHAETQTPDSVVAIVNGQKILESDIKTADDILGRNIPSSEPLERRDSIVRFVIDGVLLAQAAKDRNIVDEADLQRRTTYARNQGLAEHLLAVVGQQAVTEEAMRKAYEEVVVKGAPTEPELHLRHILFMIPPPADDAAVKAAEQKAQAAIARINKGEDFAVVVSEMSDDPVTKSRGGDYDWRLRGEMGKEYADVAFKLKKGEVSAPFKTAVGWHILKLEDMRTRKPVEYEKIRDRIAAVVANAAQLQLVDKVRSEAKIEHVNQPQPEDKETVGRK
jgi:peptidyl-prolyl cis-trans isomerase C